MHNIFPSNGKQLLCGAGGILRAEENWSLSLILLNSIFHSEPQNSLRASDVKSNLALIAETNKQFLNYCCDSFFYSLCADIAPEIK